MVRYKIDVVDGNIEGDVLRCPNCGQVLYILNGLEGKIKTTVQCRRCHNFVEVNGETMRLNDE